MVQYSNMETQATIQEIQNALRELVISQKETDAKFKATDKRINQAFELFEGQWGKLMESLVEGDIINLLRSRDIDVHDTSMRRKGNHLGRNFEFDIIAHNGNQIVIVEVKTSLRVRHVKDFIEKLKHAKTWMEEYAAYNVYGAVAFLRAEEDSAVFAENEQLFIIRATGNSATIENKSDFIPKIF